MSDDRKRLLYRMAGQIDDVYCAIGLVSRVSTTAVCKRCYTGGLIPNRNCEGSAECLAVIAVDVQTHVDHADRTAVVIGHNQLLGNRVVLGVDRAGYGGDMCTSQPGCC